LTAALAYSLETGIFGPSPKPLELICSLEFELVRKKPVASRTLFRLGRPEVSVIRREVDSMTGARIDFSC
jgi:hypothetical protein